MREARVLPLEPFSFRHVDDIGIDLVAELSDALGSIPSSVSTYAADHATSKADINSWESGTLKHKIHLLQGTKKPP